MAELNLLQGKYDGKLGQTVGAKWKNKATVRSYTKARDPKTAEQLNNRSRWSQMLNVYRVVKPHIEKYVPLDTSKFNLWCAFQNMNANFMNHATQKTYRNILIAKGNLATMPDYQAVRNGTNLTVTMPYYDDPLHKGTRWRIVYFSQDEKRMIQYDITTKANIPVGLSPVANVPWQFVFAYMWWTDGKIVKVSNSLCKGIA